MAIVQHSGDGASDEGTTPADVQPDFEVDLSESTTPATTNAERRDVRPGEGHKLTDLIIGDKKGTNPDPTSSDTFKLTADIFKAKDLDATVTRCPYNLSKMFGKPDTKEMPALYSIMTNPGQSGSGQPREQPYARDKIDAAIHSLTNAYKTGGQGLLDRVVETTNSNLWLDGSPIRLRDASNLSKPFERSYELFHQALNKPIQRFDFALPETQNLLAAINRRGRGQNRFAAART